MDRSLRKTADAIVRAGIEAVLPDAAVARALERFDPGGGRVVLVAAGKAAWQMARAALDCLGHVDAGIVITKYGHVRGELPGVVCCEAGHPVPDQAGFDATRRALALVQGLAARDRVLFLLSGGGSALLEQPLLPAGQLQDITRRFWPAGRISWRSTPSASGCPPSRAGGSRWPAPRPGCSAWCSAIFWATLWT